MKTRPRRLLQSAALSLVLACVVPIRVSAEVQLSGTQDNVVLRANSATMAEILSGISSTFNLRIELTGALARQFTGAYTGSLRHVLSRLLDGENYIIGSAADGMTIVLLDRKGGAPIAATVAKLPSAAGPPAQRAGAEQPVKLAAVGDADNNPVQGWTGSGAPLATPVSAAAPAAPAQPNSAAAVQPVKLAAGDDENNPVQGWTGSGVQFATPASAATPAASTNTADAAKPHPDSPEGDSGVQGWVPVVAQDPFKDVGAKLAPIDQAAAAASSGADEGNPNFQGYMPDWTPPDPGKSMLDSMPMLPGAPIRMHRQ